MNSNLLLSMPGGAEWFLILLVLAYFGWWIYTIVEITTSKFKDNGSKALWLVLVIFLGFIGTLIYWVAGRPNRIILNKN